MILQYEFFLLPSFPTEALIVISMTMDEDVMGEPSDTRIYFNSRYYDCQISMFEYT
jgi:hypothetical protein